MKKASVRVIFLIAGILFTQSALAQKNYLPAKLFTISGDTISGYIDYRNWGNNPYKVSFKTSPESEGRIYKPFDIKGFSVKDDIYVSAEIKRETSPIKTGELNYGPEIHLENDVVFLQALILGPKSLFYFKSLQENKDQFYIQQDSEFQLLIFKKYLKEVETASTTQEMITENKTYLGQLRLYLAGCPSIQSALKTVKYDKKDLQKLFQYYYDCTHTKMDFEKKVDKVKLELGVLLGVSRTTVKFKSKSNVYRFLMNSDFQPSIFFSAAFFADIVFPRNQRKFSLENELFFNRYSFTSEYTETVSENQYTIYTTKIGASYLKLNIMFRFKYPAGKTFLFINGGISGGVAIAGINSLKKYSKFYEDEHTTYQSAIQGTRIVEQSLLLGLGFRYSWFTFEARLETGNGMSNIEGLQMRVNRLYFLLGFRFK